jgi:hypothetical protein
LPSLTVLHCVIIFKFLPLISLLSSYHPSRQMPLPGYMLSFSPFPSSSLGLFSPFDPQLCMFI